MGQHRCLTDLCKDRRRGRPGRGQPLRRRLPPRTYRRLLKALAVVYGIEPMIILKDICGATDRETEAVVRWMMDALVDAALREH